MELDLSWLHSYLSPQGYSPAFYLRQYHGAFEYAVQRCVGAIGLVKLLQCPQHQQESSGKLSLLLSSLCKRLRYLHHKHPFASGGCAMQGSTEEKEQASLVLLEVLEAARVVAVMLTPIAPALARLVYLQLGFSDQEFDTLTWADAQWGGKLLCKHLGPSPFGKSCNHGTSTSQMYVLPCITCIPDGCSTTAAVLA